eukprot:128322_1
MNLHHKKCHYVTNTNEDTKYHCNGCEILSQWNYLLIIINLLFDSIFKHSTVNIMDANVINIIAFYSLKHSVQCCNEISLCLKKINFDIDKQMLIRYFNNDNYFIDLNYVKNYKQTPRILCVECKKIKQMQWENPESYKYCAVYHDPDKMRNCININCDNTLCVKCAEKAIHNRDSSASYKCYECCRLLCSKCIDIIDDKCLNAICHKFNGIICIQANNSMLQFDGNFLFDNCNGCQHKTCETCKPYLYHHTGSKKTPLPIQQKPLNHNAWMCVDAGHSSNTSRRKRRDRKKKKKIGRS